MHKQQTAFENIVGREDIACDKQFLLFPQCFFFFFVNLQSTIVLPNSLTDKCSQNLKVLGWLRNWLLV